MKKTPKSLRLQIGIFGRANVGKSSFLNLVAGQDVAITSSVAGTTTDVVEKTMELLPLGPVVFLDTAGINDASELGSLRLKKTNKVFDRADVIILICEPGIWTDYEEGILKDAGSRRIPVILMVNKIDLAQPGADFLDLLKSKSDKLILGSSLLYDERERLVGALKECLIKAAPEDFLNPLSLLGDLLPSGGLAVFIVPIDLQAPKGRLILPQVQAIRDALDNDSAVTVVKEREYAHLLGRLKIQPDLVVCDSQVVLKMTADTPVGVKCTTFSILFSRFKGDLIEAVRGVKVIERLKAQDKVLISEACSHHAIEDDIGRVKIPRWLRQYVGADIKIDVCSGSDYPDNLKEYKLVIHCGACMLTRRQMLCRIQKAKEAGVAVTNYGVCIAFLQGVLKRALSPFPLALELLESSAP
ncbi:MAG: [FeFe] hydrogenase H-cluster maturation GTPase HydF [Candidatus Omnitrophica bacterium]|nr:[FeFe] hydrogenase H-cluster maturation GTPase HydF [Candidatus Omnitrophota bacterium]MDD5771790.1 [FeFe] hydrogenase H-cluster maturation GTPase HydF [Candidatus Omnitrophota bacterium]